MSKTCYASITAQNGIIDCILTIFVMVTDSLTLAKWGGFRAVLLALRSNASNLHKCLP